MGAPLFALAGFLIGGCAGGLHLAGDAFAPAATDILALLLATARGIQNAVAATDRPAKWRPPKPKP